MKDDFMSTKNAYCIDTDDPSVATTGYGKVAMFFYQKEAIS